MVGKGVVACLAVEGERVVVARGSVEDQGGVVGWVAAGTEEAMVGEERVVGWVVVETAVGLGVGWGVVVVPAEVRRVAV